MITLTIDGVEVKGNEGETILEVARRNNISVPTLCYLESLTPSGSCRICVVEVTTEKRGKKKTWVDASCVCPIEEGMVVQTKSPKIMRERRVILELLLSRAPVSEKLLELAREYNADPGKYTAVDKGEANCILCGLCVRVCSELIHSYSITTAFRGVRKKVLTPFKIAQDVCIGCGACAYVCPTGVIKIIEEGEKVNVNNWAELDVKRCRECGKLFGPVIQLEKLQKDYSLNIDAELYDLCPDCRRKILENQITKTSGMWSTE